MERVVVPGPVLDRIREDARASYPEECCGLLVGAREGSAVQVARAIACANVAAPGDRGRRFMIEPGTLVDAIRSLREAGEELIGIYHSHPDADATPSVTDMTFVALWPETVWLIVAVGAEAVGERAWWLPLSAEGGERPRELMVDALVGGGSRGRGRAE